MGKKPTDDTFMFEKIPDRFQIEMTYREARDFNEAMGAILPELEKMRLQGVRAQKAQKALRDLRKKIPYPLPPVKRRRKREF